jgi:hypothetical protein
MKKIYQVQHNEHVARRPFDDVIQAFEQAVGSAEGDFVSIVARSRDTTEFERLVREREGPSGFIRFLTADHGAWAALNDHTKSSPRV